MKEGKFSSYISMFQVDCLYLEDSEKFYSDLFSLLGEFRLEKSDNFTMLWGHFGILLQEVQELEHSKINIGRTGVKKINIFVSNRDKVDEIYQVMSDKSYDIVWEPKEESYAPGYYSLCLKDPDQVQIEIVFNL